MCPFLYLPISISLPGLMSRQGSLTGLHISTWCTTASMAIFLALLVMLLLHLRDHSGLQTFHLSLLSSPGSPYYPAPGHLTWSPLGIVLVVYTSRLWLCQFLFFLIQVPLQPFWINPKSLLPSRVSTEFYLLQYSTTHINYLLAFLLL